MLHNLSFKQWIHCDNLLPQCQTWVHVTIDTTAFARWRSGWWVGGIVVGVYWSSFEVRAEDDTVRTSTIHKVIWKEKTSFWIQSPWQSTLLSLPKTGLCALQVHQRDRFSCYVLLMQFQVTRWSLQESHFFPFPQPICCLFRSVITLTFSTNFPHDNTRFQSLWSPNATRTLL